MESFIRTITLLIVINLIAAGFAPAQKYQNPSQQKVSELDKVIKDEKKALTDPKLGDFLNKLNIARATQYAGGGSAGKILVIPTGQIKTKEFVEVMEDLNIMSRIFDRKIGLPVSSAVPILGDVPFIGKLYSRGSRATESIYLQGFGAMFFMSVNFPLSPPPKVQAAKTDEGADPVWEQTKQQIRESKKEPDLDYVHQRDAATKQYDSEKAEELKTNLIKALKHASNIRNLKKDESVTVVVAGTLPALVVSGHGDEPHRYYYIQYGKEKGISRPSLLTIRAKKSDIDAFAKDELDFDAFRKKVVTFTHPYLSSDAGGGRSSSTRIMISR